MIIAGVNRGKPRLVLGRGPAQTDDISFPLSYVRASHPCIIVSLLTTFLMWLLLIKKVIPGRPIVFWSYP